MGWISLVFAASGIVLSPFGSVQVLSQNQQPWFGFHAEEPILWEVRVQRIKAADCRAWTQAVISQTPGGRTSLESTQKSLTRAWNAWEPWGEEDSKTIKECDEFPCDIKLNRHEIKLMAATPSKSRIDKLFDLMVNRVIQYEKTGIHDETEFPGLPKDPWALLKKHGYVSQLSQPTRPEIWFRKLDFAPGKILPIRQIFDWRIAKSSSGMEATIWARDIFTDHYFDSWGEWIHLSCESTRTGKGVILIQALVMELDLLKKEDLMSKLMRGKMKSTVEENGKIFLEKRFKEIQALVKK